MIVKILGSAAGGGFPQWNCGCANCSGLRSGRIRSSPRSQLQVAVSPDGHSWLLLNASPDLRSQIEGTPSLHPRSLRDTPIAGVVLTSGDLDNVLGLLLLRELQPIHIFATPGIRQVVRHDNSFFRMLSRTPEQSQWTDICVGQNFHPLPDVCFQPISLAGGFPHWVEEQRAASLKQSDAVLGLVIEANNGRRLAYLPAVAAIDDALLSLVNSCDVVLFDGTFWSDDELLKLQSHSPTAREMGHVPVGGRGGTLELTRGITHPRKIFVHINNTNPMLDEDGPELQEVLSAGWEVAKDQWEFQL